MHHPTDRIVHTTVFVTPVMEHWPERVKVEYNKLCKHLKMYVILKGDISLFGHEYG